MSQGIRDTNSPENMGNSESIFTWKTQPRSPTYLWYIDTSNWIWRFFNENGVSKASQFQGRSMGTLHTWTSPKMEMIQRNKAKSLECRYIRGLIPTQWEQSMLGEHVHIPRFGPNQPPFEEKRKMSIMLMGEISRPTMSLSEFSVLKYHQILG